MGLFYTKQAKFYTVQILLLLWQRVIDAVTLFDCWTSVSTNACDSV